jgi:hypothetical protein
MFAFLGSESFARFSWKCFTLGDGSADWSVITIVFYLLLWLIVGETGACLKLKTGEVSLLI